MKFPKLAVLGNPPYQTPYAGNSNSLKPIYHLFMECVIDSLNPDYFTFITPSRWMVGGKGLSKFRIRMMNDHRISKIVHFEGERTIFPSVLVAGGVSYFLWEKCYDGPCEFVNGHTVSTRFLNEHDIVLQDNNAFGILDKVKNKADDWMRDKVCSREPFGLATNFAYFTKSGVKCICKEKVYKFVSPTSFTDNRKVLNKWKVCIPVGAGRHQIPDVHGAKMVMMNIFIVEPGAICTGTYLVVNAFDSKKEAEFFVSYMKTKFFRFLTGLRLVKNASKKVFTWVPDVEDYSDTWTDKELYDMFGLTQQEQSYIESKIKELNGKNS